MCAATVVELSSFQVAFGDQALADPWENDRLGYKDIGRSFSNLLRSLDESKVISIEAGFGRGKTFFRECWATELRAEGEVVIEIDVLHSDHSGDPVVTLLAALVKAMPKDGTTKGKSILETAKKIGAVGARVGAKAILKSGADEVFDALSDSAIDKLEDFDALDGVITNVGDEMSKIAGQLIASQMAAEKVRTEEMPQQLAALREALVGGEEGKQVIVVVDELDRCHPDYAIAFLEAMKLTFEKSGFLFCLMANPDYLERLASHRFGNSDKEEPYLDKFVDIRLRLEPKGDALKLAAEEMALALPMGVPYGDHEEFSLERAARLAGDLAVETGFSMRKLKRILLKVELALRCHPERPLDVPLLVFLAFGDQARSSANFEEFLPRSFLTPDVGAQQMDALAREREEDPFKPDGGRAGANMSRTIRERCPELAHLPRDRYKLPNNDDYYDWGKVFLYLAPHYIPDHQDVLNAVAEVMAPDPRGGE